MTARTLLAGEVPGLREALQEVDYRAAFAPLAKWAVEVIDARRIPELVRRYNTVFWRRPHVRGHARLGYVNSRTVELGVPQLPATPAGAAPIARDNVG